MHQECVATESWIRPSYIGVQAVVVGAGIAGIAAARVLANWFETVVLLERDFLPDAPMYRTGTPQARHPHVLLFGGQRALEELFPALDSDFMAAGSVPLQVNRDLREELPDGRPIPQRDFGLTCFALTRPRLELRPATTACAATKHHHPGWHACGGRPRRAKRPAYQRGPLRCNACAGA
jgi:choline dehydrogenase-like flavoprotein